MKKADNDLWVKENSNSFVTYVPSLSGEMLKVFTPEVHDLAAQLRGTGSIYGGYNSKVKINDN